jgi:HEAT repeat protein
MIFGSGTPDVEKMEKERDIKGLIKALGYKKDSNVRGKAAYALGRIGDSRAVEPLIRALSNEDSYLSDGAAKALTKIGELAVEPLIKALNNSDRLVRMYVVEALCKIGDSRAVEPLIKALNDSDRLVRYLAATALCKIDDSRVVEPLIAVARSTDNITVRRDVVEALCKIGDSRAVEPLTRALNDTSESVRKSVTEAVKKIEDQSH